MLHLQDVLAAVGSIFNIVPMMIFAMSYGFLAAPTAIGYAIGTAGMLATGQVMPISIQAGTIALVGTMGKAIKERLSMALYAGLIMAVVGSFGLIHSIMNFAGARIVFGMQAGVGIILARVGVDMIKQDKFVGLISLVVALIVYLPTQNLIYTVIASVTISSIAYHIRRTEPMPSLVIEKYKLSIHKPILNFNVVRGTLALICLTVGSNIAFGNITAGMSGATANIDALTVYSGLANLGALFGGAPVEAVISATGAAPNPMVAGALMMILMAIVLVTGLLPKLARLVPMHSIAGFLFIIGAFATLPGNAFNAFNGAERAEFLGAGIALLTTALTDPFIGLVAGTAIRLLAPLLGL